MVKYKIGGVTSAAGITFVGLNNKVSIRKDGAFIVRGYANVTSKPITQIPFLRGFFKLYNAFKMVSGTLIGKIALGFTAFGFILGLFSLFYSPTSASVIHTNVESTSSIIIFIINFILVAALVGYIWHIRNLHGLEHKIIETYNQDLLLTVENVKNQSKETPQCGGTLLGIFFFIELVWIGILGLPSIWVWLIWPSIGYEMFFHARGDKLYNKILFFPGYLIQLLSTGHNVTDKQISQYIAGFESFISREDPAYFEKCCLGYIDSIIFSKLKK